MQGFNYASAMAGLTRAQKPSAGVSPYLRYVNRPLGRRFAAAAAVVGVTPNQVTMLSGVLSLAALLLLALVHTSWWQVVVVAIVLVLAYALDSCDGQLARLTSTGSVAGEWLDHVVDATRGPLFHVAIGVALLRFTTLDLAWLLLPLAFAQVTVSRFFALILAEQLRDRFAPRVAGSTAAGTLRAYVHLPADTGIVNLIVVLLPATSVFIGIYAALLALNLLLAAATMVRKFRELSAFSRV